MFVCCFFVVVCFLLLLLFFFVFVFCLFCLFCFVFTARQDYFTHFEPSQSLGGAKTGDPREKPPGHPQAEFGLSHMWPERGSTHSGEMTSDLDR